MSDYFVGEIRIFGCRYAPQDWALCDGSSLLINQNQALYSLLQTQYGGNGSTNFCLPDLRGRTPLCFGKSRQSGINYAIGIAGAGGCESVAVGAVQVPAHNHAFLVSNTPGTGVSPAGTYWAQTVDDASGSHPIYGSDTSAPIPLNGTTLSTAGASAAHANMQPFTVGNFCISLTGVYPPRG